MTTCRTLCALALLAITLSACGSGPSDSEINAARDGAAECAARIDARVTAAAPAGFAPDGNSAATAKPNTAAPLIGFAGEPPIALGYRSADGNAIAFAVVPPSQEPSLQTTYAEALELEGVSWFLAPSSQAGPVRRCLGGSQG